MTQRWKLIRTTANSWAVIELLLCNKNGCKVKVVNVWKYFWNVLVQQTVIVGNFLVWYGTHIKPGHRKYINNYVTTTGFSILKSWYVWEYQQKSRNGHKILFYKSETFCNTNLGPLFPFKYFLFLDGKIHFLIWRNTVHFLHLELWSFDAHLWAIWGLTLFWPTLVSKRLYHSNIVV